MKRLLALALALVVTGCAPEKAPGTLQGRLADSIQAVGEQKQPLRMADATPFAWERLYVFAPYTPAEEIQRELGFAWPEARRTGIEERDGVTLLVFVKDRRVVKHLAFPRNLGDFSMIRKPGGFTPEEAVFAIAPEGKDPTWWVLTESKPSR